MRSHQPFDDDKVSLWGWMVVVSVGGREERETQTRHFISSTGSRRIVIYMRDTCTPFVTFFLFFLSASISLSLSLSELLRRTCCSDSSLSCSVPRPSLVAIARVQHCDSNEPATARRGLLFRNLFLCLAVHFFFPLSVVIAIVFVVVVVVVVVAAALVVPSWLSYLHSVSVA